MDNRSLAGVRAIIARNDALARDAVGVLFGGLQAQQARRGALGSSSRWIAIVQLFEEEARKFIRGTSEDVRRLNTTSEGFDVLESAFQNFVVFLEEKYFDIARHGAAFGGSRPNPDQPDNPFSRLWWQGKERLQLEIEACRADFDQPPRAVVAQASDSGGNKGGKPLAEHWDQMWATIAVQLWEGEIDPKSQADVKSAMFAWFNDHEINVGDTAVTQRARALWFKIEARR